MKSITPNVVNGVVGLSVLAMFIVAVVAGQARSNSEASTLSRLANKVEVTAVTVKVDASTETKVATR
jgi:hypothetical protein